MRTATLKLAVAAAVGGATFLLLMDAWPPDVGVATKRPSASERVKAMVAESELDHLRERARAEYRARSYRAALRVLQEWARRVPDSEECSRLLQRTYLGLDETEAAFAEYERFREISPKVSPPRDR